VLNDNGGNVNGAITTAAAGSGTLNTAGTVGITGAIGATNALAAVNVNSGALTLGGNLAATTSTVASGATLNLASSSTVSGALVDNGTVNLGSGTTTITGSVGGSGVLDVAIGANGHSVLANASAGTNLNGLTITPVFAAGATATAETLVFDHTGGGGVTLGNVAVTSTNSSQLVWSLSKATAAGTDGQGNSYGVGDLVLIAAAPVAVNSGGTVDVVNAGSPVNVTGGSGTTAATITTVGAGGTVAVSAGTPNIGTITSGGTVNIGTGGNANIGAVQNATLAVGTGANATVIAVSGGSNLTVGTGSGAVVGTVADSAMTVNSGAGSTVSVTSVTGASNLTVGSGSTVSVQNLSVGATGGVAIGTGSTVSVTPTTGTNTAFNGSLTGGTLQMNGAGTLTLNPVGVVTTTLSVPQGTVALAAGATVNAPVTVSTGGTVTMASGSTITAPVNVNTGGAFTVASGATINTTQPVAVSGGSLLVSGTITAPVTVANGGNFGGGGTVIGDVTLGNGGVFQPGHSPALTSVAGNVGQGSGSTLSLDIDGGVKASAAASGAGTYSAVAITGGAYTIGSTAIIQINLRNITGSANNSYIPPVWVAPTPGAHQFQVVTADGGVIGTFGTTNLATAGLLPGTYFKVSYDADDVYLDVTRKSLQVQPTNSANAGALFGAANYSGANQQMTSLVNSVVNLTTVGDANHAAAQLRPNVNGGVTLGAMQATTQALNIVGGRTDQLRTGGSGVSSGETALGFALWGKGFGFFGNQGSRDGIDGYKANTEGLAFGADTAVLPGTRVGAAVSWADTRVLAQGDNTGSSLGIDSYQGTLYTAYNGQPWYLNGAVGVTYHDYSGSRQVNFTGFSDIAHSNFSGMQYTAKADGGYPFALGGGTVLTPTAGVTYSQLDQRAYSETSGSGSALVVGAATTASVKSLVGGKVEQSFTAEGTSVTPEFRLGWQHEFDATAQQTTAQFVGGGGAFPTTGARPNQDTAVVGLGVTLMKSQDVSASINYDAEIGEHYTGQTGSLQIRSEF